MVTILFIPLSAAHNKLDADWAEAGAEIVRRCPICLRDSIIGHGRRRKQAHDEDHDWIPIRRGLCNLCGKTFTLLPRFSPPYCHYSLMARSQALRRLWSKIPIASPILPRCAGGFGIRIAHRRRILFCGALCKP